jgi:fucose permease
VPYRNLFIGSFLLPVIGIFMLTRLGLGTTPIYIIVAFFILGIGLGVLFGGDNLIVQESVDKENSGVALGTVQLFQSLGATIGLSVFGSLLASHIRSGVSSLASELPPGTADNIETGGIPAGLPHDLVMKIQTVFASSFSDIFAISLVFAIVAFVICLFLKKEVLTKRDDDANDGAEAGSGVAVAEPAR